MPSILIGVDNKTRITHWNLRARKITRISQEVAKGQSLEKIFPQLENGTEYVQKAIESQQVYHHSRSTRQNKDRIVYEDITIYPLVTNGVDGAVIRIDDATERVQMEEMMAETEKMLSVGGLAAGIAHEINNPLAGMMQSAIVMKSRLESTNMPANLQVAEELGIKMENIRAFMDKRDIFRMIDAINDAGSRAAEIVNTMLSFARKSDAGDISFHYPNKLMDEILELAATDYDLKKKYDFKSIEIIKQYDEKLPMLPCEGARIQQVLLNILRNGAQAMHTAKTKFPRFIIRIYKADESNMVCMEIEDNGPGMDEETRSKVFDPFFTTKPVGIGTGLGLSVSYFIITRNHKGKMDVISEPGNGATFIIKLPV
jgi:PAS domain S-box-containing protein